MTKGGISVNVTGGNASFGNLSQGDSNTLSAYNNLTVEVVDDAFSTALKELETLRADAGIAQEEINALSEELKELAALVKKKGPIETVTDFVKTLYERYGWAAKPLGQLFAVLGL